MSWSWWAYALLQKRHDEPFNISLSKRRSISFSRIGFFVCCFGLHNWTTETISHWKDKRGWGENLNPKTRKNDGLFWDRFGSGFCSRRFDAQTAYVFDRGTINAYLWYIRERLGLCQETTRISLGETLGSNIRFRDLLEQYRSCG